MMTTLLIECRHLQVTQGTDGVAVQFTPQPSLTARSTQRAQQAVRIVKSALKRIKNRDIEQSDSVISARIYDENSSILHDILKSVDRKLDHLESEFLTTGMVEEILNITSRERVRWTKDGRLPNAGKASFKRGQNRVHLFIYRQSPSRIWQTDRK
jgi:hypothetical protein